MTKNPTGFLVVFLFGTRQTSGQIFSPRGLEETGYIRKSTEYYRKRDPKGLYALDQEYAGRIYNPPSLVL